VLRVGRVRDVSGPPSIRDRVGEAGLFLGERLQILSKLADRLFIYDTEKQDRVLRSAGHGCFTALARALIAAAIRRRPSHLSTGKADVAAVMTSRVVGESGIDS